MIPTAQIFVINRKDRISGISPTPEQVYQWMIEFAKMHVEAALKEAAENAEAIEGWNTGYSGSATSVDRDSILNAYPLTNIK